MKRDNFEESISANITDHMQPLMRSVFFLELIRLARYLEEENRPWFHEELDRCLDLVFTLKNKEL